MIFNVINCDTAIVTISPTFGNSHGYFKNPNNMPLRVPWAGSGSGRRPHYPVVEVDPRHRSNVHSIAAVVAEELQRPKAVRRQAVTTNDEFALADDRFAWIESATAAALTTKATMSTSWSEKIDRVAYGLVAFAFPLFTFVICAGAIWAQYAWGRYWGWDPKETWSLVVLTTHYFPACLSTASSAASAWCSHSHHSWR